MQERPVTVDLNAPVFERMRSVDVLTYHRQVLRERDQANSAAELARRDLADQQRSSVIEFWLLFTVTLFMSAAGAWAILRPSATHVRHEARFINGPLIGFQPKDIRRVR